MIYLAQPIDQGKRSPRITRLKHAAHAIAADRGLDLFSPATAYRPSSVPLDLGTMATIDRINRYAFDQSTGMIACLPWGVPTLGTASEIEQALNTGKPVAVLTDRELAERSVQLLAWQGRGALVYTLDAIEDDPLGVSAAIAQHLRTGPPVGSPAAREIMPYVRADILSTVPTKAYPDDAGLDLAASEAVTIPARSSMSIKTGLKFALPAGTWGLIVGRSSTWAKRGLDVKLGVIDAGWRGELLIVVHNPTDEAAKVEIGDRLAQYIVLPAWQGALAEVGMLPPHARGENGFGSSGR